MSPPIAEHDSFLRNNSLIKQTNVIKICRTLPFILLLLSINADAEDPTRGKAKRDAGTVFRPIPGQFPPIESAHHYSGELIFVDHATRRGSIRVKGSGKFFRNDPHPFALLPYAEVRYRGAPADLRDIPLGTIVHVYAFLPPDPERSSVPVLPIDNKQKDANHNRGSGIFPAENHVLLLEDEPSHCQRVGKSWRLEEISLQKDGGVINARQAPENQDSVRESFTVDSATRVWRERELLSLEEWLEEQNKNGSTKIQKLGFDVELSFSWQPTPDNIFTRFHISDIWLDQTAFSRAASLQAKKHCQLIRSRWMPAWVDKVKYGTFGQAVVTATLFGGMDASLYDEFKVGSQASMNSVEATLKHTHGAYGPAHMACHGPITDMRRSDPDPPVGSSGIQIEFETDLIIEGIRPGRIVRVRPASWPVLNLPREEYINDGKADSEERFPTPAIFPKY